MAEALRPPDTTQPDTTAYRHRGERGDLPILIKPPRQRPPVTASFITPTTDNKHTTCSPQDREMGPLCTRISPRLRGGGVQRGGTHTGYCTWHRHSDRWEPAKLHSQDDEPLIRDAARYTHHNEHT
ncbi:Hypothetical predicted protein [Pelobates cultripes]|uniref:Uncharacterized protein n=1 Tax=Pelobates cultripes TaxID=61616 RepID=A0AAD1W9M2_PELCU|nr:Hypothetical predicted protein [Pelobates cultripes]